MNTITSNNIAPVLDRSAAGDSGRFLGVRNFIEQAHSRRTRQEFWQWLHAQVRLQGQVRQNRANGF